MGDSVVREDQEKQLDRMYRYEKPWSISSSLNHDLIRFPLPSQERHSKFTLYHGTGWASMSSQLYPQRLENSRRKKGPMYNFQHPRKSRPKTSNKKPPNLYQSQKARVSSSKDLEIVKKAPKHPPKLNSSTTNWPQKVNWSRLPSPFPLRSVNKLVGSTYTPTQIRRKPSSSLEIL